MRDRRYGGVRAGLYAFAAVGVRGVYAQWTVVPLHPGNPETESSKILCVSQGRQGGWATTSFRDAPGVWSGSAQSWTPLSEISNGFVYAMDGDTQGGWSNPPSGSGFWASLWSGTAASQRYINPDGFFTSQVLGMHGNEQVGIAARNTPTGVEGGAALWHGTADSFVWLRPAGADASLATCTDGVHQYGWTLTTDRYRAAMWSGTAQSVVSLDPPLPNVTYSQILAAAPGREVGTVKYGPIQHAAAWSGTAGSFIDLDPGVGAGLSEANGVCESAAVGAYNAGGFAWTPCIWLGPNYQFQPLPVPAGFFQAYATSVEFYQGRYYVGGYALPTLGSQTEAFLWVGVPAPGTFVMALAGALAMARRRRN